MVLPGFHRYNFVQTLRQAVEKLCQTCQLTMNNKSQSHAKARPLARSEELKPSAFTIAIHKNRMDARIVFGGWPLRNRYHFPLASIGHCGRKCTTAFCFILKLLPVCLRAGFQFGGRINDRNEKTLGSILELSLLKNS
jgi:hypothetical protein